MDARPCRHVIIESAEGPLRCGFPENHDIHRHGRHDYIPSGGIRR
jgi:hypothetical protein